MTGHEVNVLLSYFINITFQFLHITSFHYFTCCHYLYNLQLFLTSDVFIILNFFFLSKQIIFSSIYGFWKIAFLFLCYNFSLCLISSFLIQWQNCVAQGSFIFLTGVKTGFYASIHFDYKDWMVYYIGDL